jgi:hypothetical protein
VTKICSILSYSPAGIRPKFLSYKVEVYLMNLILFRCPKACEKLTSTKILFFMVGFILCAIPLAVMTTLW